MPIYDISGLQKPARDPRSSYSDERIVPPPSMRRTAAVQEKKSFLSSFLSRIFFAALLLFDIAWGAYALTLFISGTIVGILSFGRMAGKLRKKSWLSLQRSLACGIALIAALFTPAFGIMIACTYFLMYDRDGIEEIVPSSLQDQFREFFK